MDFSTDSAPGRQRGWRILDKLGEGDAGEVFRVESLIDHRNAILKRPQRNAFPSDMIRQAAQIEKEAGILTALTSVDSPGRLMHVPALLDQSRPGTEFTERYFIVISQAQGFSLGQLARWRRFSNGTIEFDDDPNYSGLSNIEKHFIKQLVKLSFYPELLLLRVINGLIEYLEMIHSLQLEQPAGRMHGILWNDIKCDHIFWDAQNLMFTLIDWGNGQFLDEDGISKDRQHSRTTDYGQLLDEMGQFLSSEAPDLFRKLEWPTEIQPSNVYTAGILPIKEKVHHLLQNDLTARRKIRRSETDMLGHSRPTLQQFQKLEDIQGQIIEIGEVPEYSESEKFFRLIAQTLIEEGNYEGAIDFLKQQITNPVIDSSEIKLLLELVRIAQAGHISPAAVTTGIKQEWSAVLWELRKASLDTPEPDWWESLCNQIRLLEIGTNLLRPFIATNRLVHALQASKSQATNSKPYDELIFDITENVLKRWSELEPNPPDSGIEYQDVRIPLLQASELVPEAMQVVNQSLNQAESQVRIALDAWEHQDFASARTAVQRVLLWDPDRLRLIQAEKALQITPNWLEEIRNGLIHDEPLQDFVTRLELTGRELRNQVGSAAWLDDLLAALKDLRKGVEPTDVLVEHPQSRFLLDWLISLEPRRPFMSSPGKLLQLERNEIQAGSPAALSGIREAELGRKTGIILNDPLDTWAPEARGSSARLFLGTVSIQNDQKYNLAFKIMRPDRIEYALPLFREETQILSLLRDVPGVVPLVECGYIHLDSETSLPPEDRNIGAEGLKGEVLRFGLDSIHNFLADLDARTLNGWLPYLAVEKYARQDNLLLRCDTGYTNGRFLPTLEGLIMAIQICHLLESAHSRNIIYRDHKILHYYWREELNSIFMIDWNVAKRFPVGLSTAETQFDLVQFGARALHYILTGRSAPGALPLGPNKPEEIEAAAHSYKVQWTYDDQRIPKDIKDVLEDVLSGNYSEAKSLREDLTAIYLKLSELVQITGG